MCFAEIQAQSSVDFSGLLAQEYQRTKKEEEGEVGLA